MVKHTLKLLIIGIIIWAWMPTGPSDFLIIPFIISKIGLQAYIIISIIMIILLYNSIPGKGLMAKIRTAQDEISQLF